MNLPTVSIVITLYKEEKLISESILSSLNQTFNNFEIILVDNNASEQTILEATLFLKQHENKIRMIKETTQGVCSARNAGIKEARGKYICLMDADDIMKPTRLEKQIQAAENHPEAILICSEYEIFIEENGIKEFFAFGTDITLEWIDSLFKKQRDPALSSFFIPLPSTLFFSRERILQLGGFDPFYNMKAGEDIAFALSLWSIGPFFRIPEPLTSYRAKRKDLKNNITGQNWIARIERQNQLLRLIQSIYAPNYDNQLKIPLQNLKARWLLEASLDFFSYRDGTEEGKKLLRRSLALNRYSIETWKFFIKSHVPQKYFPKVFWFRQWKEEPLPLKAKGSFTQKIFT